MVMSGVVKGVEEGTVGRGGGRWRQWGGEDTTDGGEGKQGGSKLKGPGRGSVGKVFTGVNMDGEVWRASYASSMVCSVEGLESCKGDGCVVKDVGVVRYTLYPLSGSLCWVLVAAEDIYKENKKIVLFPSEKKIGINCQVLRFSLSLPTHPLK